VFEAAKTLASIRTNEGYMAEIQSLDDDSFLLIENHCPICAAAIALLQIAIRFSVTFKNWYKLTVS
jgi:predicted ArsR family transcriptional regulator